jgi:hypothetical protein
MALECIQSITKMNTKHLPGGKAWPVRKADNLSHLQVSTACYLYFFFLLRLNLIFKMQGAKNQETWEYSHFSQAFENMEFLHWSMNNRINALYSLLHQLLTFYSYCHAVLFRITQYTSIHAILFASSTFFFFLSLANLQSTIQMEQ